MDFHSLPRKELQALCKKNKIPANLTNFAMAEALKALQVVEGVKEFQDAAASGAQSPHKEVEPKPVVPPPQANSRRPATRRNASTDAGDSVEQEEPPASPPQQTSPGRRVTRVARASSKANPKGTADEKHINGIPLIEIPDTPATAAVKHRARHSTKTRAEPEESEVEDEPKKQNEEDPEEEQADVPRPLTGRKPSTRAASTLKESVQKPEMPLDQEQQPDLPVNNRTRRSRRHAASSETVTVTAATSKVRGVRKMADLMPDPDEHKQEMVPTVEEEEEDAGHFATEKEGKPSECVVTHKLSTVQEETECDKEKASSVAPSLEGSTPEADASTADNSSEERVYVADEATDATVQVAAAPVPPKGRRASTRASSTVGESQPLTLEQQQEESKYNRRRQSSRRASYAPATARTRTSRARGLGDLMPDADKEGKEMVPIEEENAGDFATDGEQPPVASLPAPVNEKEAEDSTTDDNSSEQNVVDSTEQVADKEEDPNKPKEHPKFSNSTPAACAAAPAPAKGRRASTRAFSTVRESAHQLEMPPTLEQQPEAKKCNRGRQSSRRASYVAGTARTRRSSSRSEREMMPIVEEDADDVASDAGQAPDANLPEPIKEKEEQSSVITEPIMTISALPVEEEVVCAKDEDHSVVMSVCVGVVEEMSATVQAAEEEEKLDREEQHLDLPPSTPAVFAAAIVPITGRRASTRASTAVRISAKKLEMPQSQEEHPEVITCNRRQSSRRPAASSVTGTARTRRSKARGVRQMPDLMPDPDKHEQKIVPTAEVEDDPVATEEQQPADANPPALVADSEEKEGDSMDIELSTGHIAAYPVEEEDKSKGPTMPLVEESTGMEADEISAKTFPASPSNMATHSSTHSSDAPVEVSMDMKVDDLPAYIVPEKCVTVVEEELEATLQAGGSFTSDDVGNLINASPLTDQRKETDATDGGDVTEQVSAEESVVVELEIEDTLAQEHQLPATLNEGRESQVTVSGDHVTDPEATDDGAIVKTPALTPVAVSVSLTGRKASASRPSASVRKSAVSVRSGAAAQKLVSTPVVMPAAAVPSSLMGTPVVMETQPEEKTCDRTLRSSRGVATTGMRSTKSRVRVAPKMEDLLTPRELAAKNPSEMAVETCESVEADDALEHAALPPPAEVEEGSLQEKETDEVTAYSALKEYVVEEETVKSDSLVSGGSVEADDALVHAALPSPAEVEEGSLEGTETDEVTACSSLEKCVAEDGGDFTEQLTAEDAVTAYELEIEAARDEERQSLSASTENEESQLAIAGEQVAAIEDMLVKSPSSTLDVGDSQEHPPLTPTAVSAPQTARNASAARPSTSVRKSAVSFKLAPQEPTEEPAAEILVETSVLCKSEVAQVEEDVTINPILPPCHESTNEMEESKQAGSSGITADVAELVKTPVPQAIKVQDQEQFLPSTPATAFTPLTARSASASTSTVRKTNASAYSTRDALRRLLQTPATGEARSAQHTCGRTRRSSRVSASKAENFPAVSELAHPGLTPKVDKAQEQQPPSTPDAVSVSLSARKASGARLSTSVRKSAVSGRLARDERELLHTPVSSETQPAERTCERTRRSTRRVGLQPQWEENEELAAGYPDASVSCESVVAAEPSVDVALPPAAEESVPINAQTSPVIQSSNEMEAMVEELDDLLPSTPVNASTPIADPVALTFTDKKENSMAILLASPSADNAIAFAENNVEVTTPAGELSLSLAQQQGKNTDKKRPELKSREELMSMSLRQLKKRLSVEVSNVRNSAASPGMTSALRRLLQTPVAASASNDDGKATTPTGGEGEEGLALSLKKQGKDTDRKRHEPKTREELMTLSLRQLKKQFTAEASKTRDSAASPSLTSAVRRLLQTPVATKTSIDNAMVLACDNAEATTPTVGAGEDGLALSLTQKDEDKNTDKERHQVPAREELMAMSLRQLRKQFSAEASKVRDSAASPGMTSALRRLLKTPVAAEARSDQRTSSTTRRSSRAFQPTASAARSSRFKASEVSKMEALQTAEEPQVNEAVAVRGELDGAVFFQSTENDDGNDNILLPPAEEEEGNAELGETTEGLGEEEDSDEDWSIEDNLTLYDWWELVLVEEYSKKSPIVEESAGDEMEEFSDATSVVSVAATVDFRSEENLNGEENLAAPSPSEAFSDISSPVISEALETEFGAEVWDIASENKPDEEHDLYAAAMEFIADEKLKCEGVDDFAATFEAVQLGAEVSDVVAPSTLEFTTQSPSHDPEEEPVWEAGSVAATDELISPAEEVAPPHSEESPVTARPASEGQGEEMMAVVKDEVLEDQGCNNTLIEEAVPVEPEATCTVEPAAIQSPAPVVAFLSPPLPSSRKRSAAMTARKTKTLTFTDDKENSMALLLASAGTDAVAGNSAEAVAGTAGSTGEDGLPLSLPAPQQQQGKNNDRKRYELPTREELLAMSMRQLKKQFAALSLGNKPSAGAAVSFVDAGRECPDTAEKKNNRKSVGRPVLGLLNDNLMKSPRYKC